MSKITTSLIALILMFAAVPCSIAADDSFTQKDRELLIRLDERLNQIDKRFEQIELRISELREDMNKRFEQVDKRFEQIDKRFEQVDKRFDFMLQVMIAIVGAFAAIVAVTIGFALWDRKTMIRPFETKVKQIEDDILTDRKRLEALIELLKQQAKHDQKLAALLKNFSIL